MIHFFTDHTVLQMQPSQDCAFGPVVGELSTDFRWNSVHSSGAMHPPAYAITKGDVQIYPIAGTAANKLGDPDKANLAGLTHVNLVLRPFAQPSEETQVMVPRIKYFVYRNILRDSICEPTGAAIGPKGTSEMIDLIRGKKDKDHKVADFMGYGKPFSSEHRSPVLDSGVQLGTFDRTSFSFEVLLDDLGFEPDEEFFCRPPNKCKFEHTPASSTATNAARFLSRSQREHVLHFMDPCAFYGNCYWGTFRRRTGSLGPKGETVGPKAAAQLHETFATFENRNRAYIDIRNENNRSFGFYRFVSDPIRKNLFSIYDDVGMDDSVTVSYLNDAGVLGGAVVPYYQNDWPLLIIDGESFPQTSEVGDQILKLGLPKGNNLNAVVFFELAVSSPSSNKTLDYKGLGTPTFMDLSEGSPREVELALPSTIIDGTLRLVPRLNLNYAQDQRPSSDSARLLRPVIE